MRMDVQVACWKPGCLIVDILETKERVALGPTPREDSNLRTQDLEVTPNAIQLAPIGGFERDTPAFADRDDYPADVVGDNKP